MAEIPEVPVSACMTRRIVSVSMDDTVGEVQEILANVRFRHLLVIEGGRLVGVVADTDLYAATSPHLGQPSETTRDRAALNRRVHQIMSRRPEVVRCDASLAEAIRRFDETGLSILPVLGDDDAVAGVLSWRDVMRVLARGVTEGPGDDA